MADRPINFRPYQVRAALDGGLSQVRTPLKPQPPKPEDFRGSDFGLCRAVADGVKLYSQNDYDRLPKHPTKWGLLGSVGVARDAGFPNVYDARYAVGDRLWVRENWQTGMSGDGPKIAYAATPDFVDIDAWDGPDEGVGPSFNYDRCPGAKWHEWLPDVLSNDGPWRPSIHMPRWASRLTLIVEGVKVERLQDISEEDAQAESARAAYGEPFDPDNTITDRRRFELVWTHLHGPDAWAANPWGVAISFRVIRANIDSLTDRAGMEVPDHG